jgi:hypothetical protein
VGNQLYLEFTADKQGAIDYNNVSIVPETWSGTCLSIHRRIETEDELRSLYYSLTKEQLP